MILRYLFALCYLFSLPLQADDTSAALSFMVVDMKYSQENGVKICEIQNGVSSAFKGDSFVHGGYGTVCPNFVHELSKYEIPKWSTVKIFQAWQLKEMLPQTDDWIMKSSVQEVFDDPDFRSAARNVPDDPTNISSYSGMLLVRKSHIKDIKSFRDQHPGVLIIDAPTYPFWVDKYKMSKLFVANETLSSFKPKFGLYSKKYTKNLASKIIRELSGDRFVIKPRGAFMGNGVILVDANELDRTLKYILKKNRKLKRDPDKSYHYWYRDPFDSVVVEQFFASDPISVPHFDNRVFQPTMRVVVLMIQNKENIEIRFLGNYWQFPLKSLDEEGSLNEKHKTWVSLPHYAHVDPEVTDEVNSQLETALTLLYEQMLKFQ